MEEKEIRWSVLLPLSFGLLFTLELGGFVGYSMGKRAVEHGPSTPTGKQQIIMASGLALLHAKAAAKEKENSYCLIRREEVDNILTAADLDEAERILEGR